MQLDASWGLAIRWAREARVWSRSELAEKINRSTVFVAKLEQGVRGPSLSTIVMLARAFEVEPIELIKWRCNSNALTSKSLSQLLKSLSQLSEGKSVVAFELSNDVKKLQSGLRSVIPSIGSVWHWEPMKSHASKRLVVTDLSVNSDGEVFVQAGQPNGLGLYVPEEKKVWNTLSRWMEACVMVEPAPWTE